MPVNLNKPAKEVDLTSDDYKDLVANLQANILKSHGRNFARHVFIRFTGPRPEVKGWIRGTSELVTTAGQQLEQIARRREDPNFDGGLVVGMFLSAKGYQFLGLDTDRFASGAFRNGMKDQSDGIFDALLDIDNKDPDPKSWESGFQKEIHALVTLADATEAVVIRAEEEIRAGLAGIGEVLTVEEGVVLRRKNAAGDHEPVEHFGYFDGISNPLFTRQDLEEERPENRDRAAWNPAARLSLVLTDDPFTGATDAFGSYLVYRKLGQDVGVFEGRVRALAQSLGTNADLAGALVVGRFKDGTPVLKANIPSPGAEVANDFNFREDRDGFRCPFHSHIRKVNPRGTTPATSDESERRRRIVRRGIPYGKPMPGVADPTPSDPNPSAERGLLFMCFQEKVEEQFEFIQRTWVDNENFPRGVFSLGVLGDTGDDPLIGQDRDEAQDWPKRWNQPAGGKKAFNFESAVRLKGGEYFFAPSLPFLRSLA